jgi:hypothetical protein
MAIYNYPEPSAPKYEKPKSIEDCLPQARRFVKKEHGRAALGPVKKGERVLISTFPDQDEYVKGAVTQAFMEEGSEKVDFIYENELLGEEPRPLSVENGWKEADDFAKAPTGSVEMPFTEKLGEAVRDYLDKNPEYTTVFLKVGGRKHSRTALRGHSHKFRNNWVFNNWEEFASKTWSFPDKLWIEIERPAIEIIGKASQVRITDPEGTHLEYSLTEEEALRFQMNAWNPGHLFLDPLQATSEECSMVTVSPKVPPVFRDLNGVLAGTANHQGFIPRIELFFEEGRLVEVKAGGKYGRTIIDMMDKYKDVHFPGYPDKGFFWFCDSALCTGVKAFRRTSDMFNSYWIFPNQTERNRAGIFHHGFGSRRHGEDYVPYIKKNKVPHSHIHIHNYFTTYEVKMHGSKNWVKITDKGRLTSLDDPKVRAFAVQYGDPDELLSYDWVPPLPGINCEGDYLRDYAPDPLTYLKKRMQKNKPI